MKLETMTKDERSLLLFLETRAVDYGGRVLTVHMNSDDVDIAKRWTKDGFLSFGRRKMEDIEGDVSTPSHRATHLVELSDDAWAIAHEERRARNVRMSNRHGEVVRK